MLPAKRVRPVGVNRSLCESESVKVIGLPPTFLTCNFTVTSSPGSKTLGSIWLLERVKRAGGAGLARVSRLTLELELLGSVSIAALLVAVAVLTKVPTFSGLTTIVIVTS